MLVLRGWYLVLSLDLQYFFQGIDVGIVSLLVGPIEAALHVNDAGFASITATPLAVAMALVYYPAGLLADRFNRRSIVGAAAVVWTLAAFVSAVSGSAAVFFVARLLAGIGMSGTIPPAFSMITDALPPARRALVFAVFDSLAAAGRGVGLLVCGILYTLAQRLAPVTVFGRHLAAWQSCFLLVGALGAIGTLLVYTIREPQRRSVTIDHEPTLAATLRGFGRYVARHRLLWTLYPAGIAFFLIGFFGVITWGPELGVRRFGLSSSAAAAVLGVSTAVAPFIGAVCAGAIAQRAIDRGRPDALMKLCALGCLAGAASCALLPFLPNWLWTAVDMGVIIGCVQANGVWTSIGVQESAPNQVRGQIIAIFGITQFLPQLLAPTAIALLAERTFSGPGGLGAGMALVGGSAYVLGLAAFALCSAPFIRATYELARTSAPISTDAFAAQRI